MNQILQNNDVYLYTIEFLDTKSLRNFSLSNKKAYESYLFNKKYVDKINIKKIFSHFILNNNSFIRPLNKIDEKELYIINKQMNQIYNHFNSKKYSHISDFLNFIIERQPTENFNLNSNQSKILFETFVSFCKFQKSATKNFRNSEFLYNFSNDKLSRFILTFQDLQYLLIHSHYIYFDILLNWFNIPLVPLSFIIKAMLEKENISPQANKKIIKLIDYIMDVHCSFGFEGNDNIYFESILNSLIMNKKTAIFTHLIRKKHKYGFEFNYQNLVNKCIEYESLSILKFLLIELRLDNSKNERIFTFSIPPENILKVCQNGSFDTLKYIIENLLGQVINMNKYIQITFIAKT